MPDVEASTTPGQKIRNRRFRCGLTQAQLADKCGVTTKSIYLWEKGKSNPSSRLIARVAAVLGCSIDDLLSGEAAAA